MLATRTTRCFLGIFCLLTLISATTFAVAPTQEAVDQWRAQGVLDEKLASLRAFKAAGGCSPSENSAFSREQFAQKLALNPNAVDTTSVVVILVDFSDWPYEGQSKAGTKQQFDSILFTDRLVDPIHNASGSMTDFYHEVSYGRLHVHGEIYGWYRMPQTYAYYVDGVNNGLTRGSILARHAVDAANIDVDFSKFTNDNNQVQVVIIHAGRGAEEGVYGIWSHKSTVQGVPVYDGAVIWDYTMNPEEFGSDLTPIGVFCHEFGHVLGLPDLYDTDYTPATSQGLGAWSLMASGNYNGGSQYPAHPDPWCKRQVGFLDSFYVVTENRNNVAIPAVEYNPVVYMLPDTTAFSKEYWLVENRRPYGFDAGLPGAGLLIYHVDIMVGDNNNYERYKVALEQADGLNGLALSGSRGDGSDPWPGAETKREFTDLTIPNSHTNLDVTTQVGVWEISDSDSIMYADLDYTFSRPHFVLYGSDSLVLLDTNGVSNGDGTFEPGEPVDFYCRVRNLMRNAYQYEVSLACDNPDVEFLSNNVSQGGLTIPATLSNGQRSVNPVRFRLKPGATGTISTFTVTIAADSAIGGGDRKFTKSWNFDLQLGTPQILLVDDDNNQASEEILIQSLTNLKIPHKVWNKSSLGSPTLTDLNRYEHLLWFQGDKPTGTLTASDRNALKSYLDGGGNLALSSATAAATLSTVDSVFLRDYLHARYQDSVTAGSYFYGMADNPVSQNLRWRYLSTVSVPLKRGQLINPTPNGMVTFQLSNSITGQPRLGTCGVAYTGTYKTVFMSFALEYVSDRDTAANYAHRDSLVARILTFFGGSATSVDDDTPAGLPRAFTLGQNYPNPFNPTTTIEYAINHTGRSGDGRVHTELAIYNLTGQRVRTLVDKVQGPGNYRVEWDGRGDGGAKAASGVYLYRLTRGEKAESKKMVLLK